MRKGETDGEREREREREGSRRAGGVEMLVIPVSGPLNERRQCVLGRRLEGIKAWHVL